MEKQLLPNAGLKPAYDKVVWLYVYRDFSGNPADKAAERVALRFGLTAWPQHFLVDPESLQTLANTGRAVNTFLAAVERAKVKTSGDLAAVERVRQANLRADRLEQRPDVAAATELLEDDDIVVRYRALQILKKEKPAAIAEHASTLLQIAHDPFRYEVCNTLAETKDQRAAKALQSLAARPVKSRNPNVLRMHAVKALGACGDAESIDVVGRFATTGEYLNSLTGVAVESLAGLGARDADSRSKVVELLIKAFPPPPAADTRTHRRYCTALAKRVNTALGKLTKEFVAFPEQYTEDSRALLVQQWESIGS